MKRTLVLLVVGVLLGAGSYLRFYELDQRPMHTDEAVNGVMIHQMLAGEKVAFDPSHYNGPMLRYLALPMVKISDVFSGSGLTETSLRLLTALSGSFIVICFLGFNGFVGRTASYVSLGLAAVSPPLIYYSRYFIHESIFVLCSLVFIKLLWSFWHERDFKSAIWAGVMVGILHAVRETVVIVLAAAAIGLLVAMGRDYKKHFKWMLSQDGMAKIGVLLGSGAVVSMVFYSAFFTHPQGIIDSILTYFTYEKDESHNKPWYYYLALILGEKTRIGYLGQAWVLLLAVAALWRAFCGKNGDAAGITFVRFVAGYTLATTLVYSMIAYKTPWLMLNFLVGWILLAGIGWAHLWSRSKLKSVRVLLVLLLMACCVHSLRQASLLSFRFSADPRNPFVYSQTSQDFVKLVDRIDRLQELDESGVGMRIDVGGLEYWPLPWYLREYTGVGYWTELPAESDAKIRLYSFSGDVDVPEMSPELYTTELRGLREGVFVLMFVENSLWERQFEDQ